MSSSRLYLDNIFSKKTTKEQHNDEEDCDDIITALESDEEYEKEDIDTVDDAVLDRIFGVKQAETKTILEKCREQVLDDIMKVKKVKTDAASHLEEDAYDADDHDDTNSGADEFEIMMLKERDNQVESKNCIYETSVPETKDLDLFYSNSIADCDSSSTRDLEGTHSNNRSVTWDNIHESLGIKASSHTQSDAIFQNNTPYCTILRREVDELITETSDKSDAVLDCPSCMTRVTNNCQRHETFKNHYRAMFVDNCQVDFTQEVIVKPTKSSRRQNYRNRVQVPLIEDPRDQLNVNSGCDYMIEDSNSKLSTLPSINPDGSSVFFRVRCTKCSTLIGMLDRDEVYHFYNVLASHR